MEFSDVRVIASRIDRRYAGQTVLAYLTGRFTYRDEAGWRKRLAAGEFKLNGAPVDADAVLTDGDELRYFPGDIVEPEVDWRFRVVYEDAALLVIDKPGNLPVHPAGVFFYHTLWWALKQRYGAIYPVHRLDRETSGLLVVARTAEAAAKLSRSRFEKSYFALVFGAFDTAIDADGFLCRDAASPVRRKRRFVWKGEGESARTRLEPAGRYGEYSLVKATLFTGRMHQIRATLCSLGFPVVGDKLYGPDDSIFIRRAQNALTEADRATLRMGRQALHAAALAFPHPETGEMQFFRSDLPEDICNCAKLEYITSSENFSEGKGI